MTTVWMSPLSLCDNCEAEFDGSGPMYDAATPHGWGNLCEPCFTRLGCSLGTGRGQKYELQDLNSRKAWVKTAG